MAVGPDLLQVAVPSLAGITPANYRFNVTSHEVEDIALGPEGEVPFSMRDWVQGLLSIEEGIEDRRLPKYVHAQGVDASFPGQILVQAVATTLSVAGGQPALAAPKRQVDWVPSGGTLNTYLIGDGRYVHRLTGSNEWTSVFDAGVGNETKDIIGANDFLELALGPTRLAQESSNGTSWATLSIFADRYAALNDQLWRAVRPNLAYNTLFSSNPYAWSSAYTISDSSYDITSLTAVEQVLMIGKEDGVYSLDGAGETVAFSPELRPQANADFASQRATGTFNNDYYFRTLNGLIQIAAMDGLKNRVGMDAVASPDVPTPVVKAVCADDRYLYAILDHATNLLILRRSSAGAWHPWHYEAGVGRASHIAFSGVLGYPAIFFSYDSGGGAYVTKFIRTSTFPNPLQDTNYRYDTGASFYIRFPRIGNAQSDLLIDHIQAKTLGCAAGRTIQFQTNTDEAGWVNFGSAIASGPNVTVVPTIPITGAFVDIRAILTTNSATVSPVLKGFSVKGMLRPKRRMIHLYQVTLGREETGRQGVQAIGVNKQVDNLIALKQTNAFAMVKDENGRQFEATVLDVKRGRGAKKPDEPFLFGATITFAEKVAS